MGGSGGFFSSQVNPSEMSQRLRSSENETERKEYETDIASSLDKQLTTSARDIKAVNKHLQKIKDTLSNEIEGTVDTIFGGSVAKHTFVNGLSDIDTLVILNRSELENMSPQKVLDYFFSRLSGRFPKTVIEKGDLAITVKFNDAEIQLLPALKKKTGVKIADPVGKGWIFIKPKKFQTALTKVNNRNNGKVVQTIKLAKSIIANFAENRRLSGYHIEALAVQIFRNYTGNLTQKEMLKHFFDKSSKRVIHAMEDVTGQSGDLTSYLGKSGGLKRKMAADSLANMARRMENADTACSISQWRDILAGI